MQEIDVDLSSNREDSRSVESKWRHDVPCSWDCLSIPVESDFERVLSFLDSFRFWQFCPQLFDFFWFVPDFVEAN